MRTALWAIICVCSFVTGLGAGWQLKENTTRDRYISSLAERHEATADYFNQKTDQMIQDNERKYSRGK